MSDQAFITLGTIVAWFAAVLAAVALLGDWIRQRFAGRRFRRRRCPKCWYDLSHTPGLTCSECGYIAKRERKLFKARRRWGLVALALPMVIGSYALRVTPSVEQRGWVAAVPTTVAILAVPFLRPDLAAIDAATSDGSTPMPLHLSWQTSLYLDLLTVRLEDQKCLWSWQPSLIDLVCRLQSDEPKRWEYDWDSCSDHLLGTTRWHNGQVLEWHPPESVKDVALKVTTRSAWPAGSHIYASLNVASPTHGTTRRLRVHAEPVNRGMQRFSHETDVGFDCGMALVMHPWTDGLINLGVPSDAFSNLQYELVYQTYEFCVPLNEDRWLEAKREVTTIPTTIGPSALTPFQSDVIDQALSRWLKPDLGEKFDDQAPSGCTLGLELCSSGSNETFATFLMEQEQVTVAFIAEIMIDQIAVGAGQAWFEAKTYLDETYLSPDPRWIRLDWLDVERVRAYGENYPFKLRIRGDSTVALRDFDCQRYWSGEVVVPLTVSLD